MKVETKPNGFTCACLELIENKLYIDMPIARSRPTGLPGPKGAKGLRGRLTGGEDLKPGPRGDRGEPGLSGMPGLKGDEGSPGQAGEVGGAGAQGPPGEWSRIKINVAACVCVFVRACVRVRACSCARVFVRVCLCVRLFVCVRVRLRPCSCSRVFMHVFPSSCH